MPAEDSSGTWEISHSGSHEQRLSRRPADRRSAASHSASMDRPKRQASTPPEGGAIGQQRVDAEIDAFVADQGRGRRNHLPNLLRVLPAEGARRILTREIHSPPSERLTDRISGGAQPAHCMLLLRLSLAVLAWQPVAPGDHRELATNGLLDGDHRMYFEYECREHRTELANGHQVVAFQERAPR
jgi:hypothetical protein